MCRNREDGGRRCPCDSDPRKKALYGIMQVFNRHTRGMVAAEIDGDHKAVERHAACMERAAMRESEYTEAQQAVERGETRQGLYTVDNTATLSDQELRSLRRDNIHDPAVQDDIDRIIDWRAQQDEPVEDVVDRELEAQQVWGTDPSWTISRDPGENLARSPIRKLNKEQACREDYENFTHNQFLRAEYETSGNMLNAKGRAKNIDPMELFRGDPRRAASYASDELKTWFRENRHASYKKFRHDYFGWDSDREAAMRETTFTGWDDAA